MHIPVAIVERQASSTPTPPPSITSGFASSTRLGSITQSSASATSRGSTPTTASSTSSTPTPSQTAAPDNSHGTKSNSTTFAAVGVVVGLLVAFCLIYFTFRMLRKRYPEPKYVPTNYLKNVWTRWTPKKPTGTRDSSGLEQLSSRTTTTTTSQAPSSLAAAANSAANREANAAIDRNTSVRSVMTLPPYNPKPGESEQVLGREGERGGIDTVIEFPESEMAAERQRDEEMEALYQVRLARRTEAQERAERRRLRSEARERGDWAALRELRGSTSNNDENDRLETARATHEAVRSRERAVSSVSYADLGVARHDGTRIRANSEESERPLLGDAASMASTQRTGLGMHHRDRSRSSVLSIDTQGSNEFPSPGLSTSRTRADSNASGLTRPQTGSMSSPEIIDHENEDLPDHEPPEYVDVSLEDGNERPAPMGAPPEYMSPVDARAPNLPVSPVSPTSIPATETATTSLGSGVATPASNRSSSSRGVGGVPQLPSLRLSHIPSISVSESSPIVRERSQERS